MAWKIFSAWNRHWPIKSKAFFRPTLMATNWIPYMFLTLVVITNWQSILTFEVDEPKAKRKYDPQKSEAAFCTTNLTTKKTKTKCYIRIASLHTMFQTYQNICKWLKINSDQKVHNNFTIIWAEIISLGLRMIDSLRILYLNY